jgi:polyphosphate kinase
MTFPVPAEMRAAAPRRLPHRVLTGHVESIFRILQERDVLLHLPWHSFSLFLDFLREASLDPYVDSIRLTQYRLARHSCVASALITAAQNGKEVTVLVEPQARFDEQQNISWAQRYQEAGVKVILGVPGLKVHAKMAVVTRNEHGEPRHYSALGTGNFNEETSRFYTDHLLMTARQEIGEDVVESFRFFETNWQPPELRELVAAPFRLRAAVTPARRGLGGKGAEEGAAKPPTPRHVAMRWAQRLMRSTSVSTSVSTRVPTWVPMPTPASKQLPQPTHALRSLGAPLRAHCSRHQRA